MTNPLILLVGGGHAAGKKLASDLLETGLRERFDKINIHKINMADYMIEDKVKDGSRDPSCFRFEEIDNRVKELEEDESIDIIIVYGLYALYDEELVKKGTLSIFIDTDSDVRLGRWIKRDILWPAKKNPSLKREQPERLKELLSVYLKKSRVEMKNYVSRTRENADVVLPNVSEMGGIGLIVDGLDPIIRKKSVKFGRDGMEGVSVKSLGEDNFSSERRFYDMN